MLHSTAVFALFSVSKGLKRFQFEIVHVIELGVKSILMKNLNVTLKCHGGQVTWWDGAGQEGAKQGVVHKPTLPNGQCVTSSRLKIRNLDFIRFFPFA